MENVVIIPARGNSKGIKKKNLLNFCSKPLLYWSIIQAKKSKFKNHIYISSESDEIKKLCNKMKVKFIKRPKKLCSDTSSSESALIHALKVIGGKVKNIIFLQATSPLRKPKDIDMAFNLFKKTKSDSLMSAHKAEDFFDVWKLKNKKYIPMTIDYKNRKPRQLFKEKHFLANGSIFIFKKNILKKFSNRLGGKIMLYGMEEWQSFQLDNLKQKKNMEMLFKSFLLKYYV
tara:strand:+ start:21306 stop:21995 length:690 start_codon:yes stop_codon:yes gene_type:complete